MTFPYLPHSAPPASPAAYLTSPSQRGGKRQLGGGGKWGMREGPSVGFFTCLEQTAGNERSRKKLPAAQLLRPPAQWSPPAFPPCHSAPFFSSSSCRQVLQSGNTGGRRG